MKPRSPTPVRLNLGSGPCSAPGWTNFDWGALPLLSKFPRLRRCLVRFGSLPAAYDISWPPIQLVDLRRRWPLANRSVGSIYCSHVLEHFERWEALHILREARRVLCLGGAVRVVVPDLERIFRCYLDEVVSGMERTGREASRRIWGHPKEEKPVGWLAQLRRSFIRGHEWMYDEMELRLLMLEAGFSAPYRCEFRKGTVPDLHHLDLDCHRSLSLYMEAIR